MKGSLERVRVVVNGEMPDRAPLYDLLRNDEVINHFTGETLTVDNGGELVYRAYAPAVDATRPLVRPPTAEGESRLPDGRLQKHSRWTSWTEHRRFADAEAYAAAKRAQIDSFDPTWSDESRTDPTLNPHLRTVNRVAT